MEILAVVPARSGSKSVKDKNIRLLNGKPMIAYTIEHALHSKLINRVIVSTDSKEYARIAKEYGAEIPFIRPQYLAEDNSLDIAVFQHALDFLKKNENYFPDIVVHLRPTYPIRKVEDIDCMIKLMIERNADSVRCIAPAKEIAYKMWKMDEEGMIYPVLNDIPEAYNMPRQVLPQIYYQNACIDVIRSNVIMQMNSMTGTKIMGYQMKENYDIDTEEEFRYAELRLKLEAGNHTFVFDVDGVVAEFREDLRYDLALPNRKMIKIINQLHQWGNTIILFSERGTLDGKKWEAIMREQMKRWGVRFDELKFKKPDADFYVDDKMISIDALYGMIR